MSLGQPLRTNGLCGDASGNVRSLLAWTFPTSLNHANLSSAFRVTRQSRLSSTLAQAPRDTVCCDPAALLPEVNLSTRLQSPWLPEKKNKSPGLPRFGFKEPPAELLSETKMPAALCQRGKPGYSRKALRRSALHKQVPEDVRWTKNPTEIKGTFFSSLYLWSCKCRKKKPTSSSFTVSCNPTTPRRPVINAMVETLCVSLYTGCRQGMVGREAPGDIPVREAPGDIPVREAER